MDVTGIHIERFKAISDLKLSPRRLTVLTGPNNAGKSSVLQAIQFATSISQTALLYSTGGLARGTLAVEQLLYSPLRDVAALAPNMRFTQKAASEIKISFTAELLPGQSEATSVTVRRGKNANVSYNVTDNPLGQALAELARPFSVLVTGLAGIPRQEELKSEGLVRKAAARGDANSVLRNVLWLLHSDEDAWIQFQKDLASVFPGFSLTVTFDPGVDDFINVTFASGSAHLPIDAAGTGVLQAIQLLSYVNVYRPALLLLDEPDSHLHPNNQRALARLLVRLSAERQFQILMTTHSRHFLDEMHGHAETYWFAGGKVATSQFDVVQALVDLGALDAVDILIAKDVVILSEDSNTEPVKAVMEAAGINQQTAVICSFSGCSNVLSTFPVADFIRQHAPGVKIVVHRDRDYEVDATITTLQDDLSEASIVAFIPDAVDIESCFIVPEHINELYPEITVARAVTMIDAATLATKQASLDRLIQQRTLQAAKKTQGGLHNLNIPNTTRAAETEYNEHPERFRYGKTVLGNLTQEIRQVVGRNIELFRSTDALRARPEVARLRDALAQAP